MLFSRACACSSAPLQLKLLQLALLLTVLMMASPCVLYVRRGRLRALLSSPTYHFTTPQDRACCASPCVSCLRLCLCLSVCLYLRVLCLSRLSKFRCLWCLFAFLVFRAYSLRHVVCCLVSGHCLSSFNKFLHMQVTVAVTVTVTCLGSGARKVTVTER